MVIRGGRPRVVAIVGVILGFAVPAAVVYVVLRRAWPPAHDLSDIGTGLLRDGLTLTAGICGCVVVALYLRRRR
jgi:hypothetical protein